MNALVTGALTIFAGIITLAIISVIIGQNSKAPAAISAIGAALSNVVSAAVQPVTVSAATGAAQGQPFSNPFPQTSAFYSAIAGNG